MAQHETSAREVQAPILRGAAAASDSAIGVDGDDDVAPGGELGREIFVAEMIRDHLPIVHHKNGDSEINLLMELIKI